MPYALDLLVVTVLVLVGRVTHDEGLASVATLQALWPFLGALALGWGAAASLRRPLSGLTAGSLVWLVTLFAGMGLRALSGQGTALPFLFVATLVLGAGFVGWRLVGIPLRRDAGGRHRQDEGAPESGL